MVSALVICHQGSLISFGKKQLEQQLSWYDIGLSPPTGRYKGYPQTEKLGVKCSNMRPLKPF